MAAAVETNMITSPSPPAPMPHHLESSCNKIQKIEYFDESKDRIPTNEASNFASPRYTPDLNQNDSPEQMIVGEPLTSTSFAELLPWLPVSKGDIKKTAQTRFVNSSPKSYRLMPSSIESSQFDRTSFVEKASHKFLLPVNYFLDIAKLWAISNRSELECRFTLAHTVQESKSLANLQEEYNQEKHKPICHSKSSSSGVCLLPQTNSQSEVTGGGGGDPSATAAEDLLRSVHRFLASCKLKDQSTISASQIVSLMDKKFAVKLVQQQNSSDGSNPSTKPSSESSSPSRKRTMSTDVVSPSNSSGPPSGVNVFTVSSDMKESSGDVNNNNTNNSSKEQFVIIQIPTTTSSSSSTDTSSPSKALPCRNASTANRNEPATESNGAIKMKSEDAFSCFYCPSTFNEQSTCARHMLTHLKSP